MNTFMDGVKTVCNGATLTQHTIQGLRAEAEKVKSVRAQHGSKTLFQGGLMRAGQAHARKRGREMGALALLVSLITGTIIALRMEAATQRLVDTEKALNRRLDESAWLVREHQTGESENDHRQFLILGDIEARIAAKSAARKKRRSGSGSGGDCDDDDDGFMAFGTAGDYSQILGVRLKEPCQPL
ncbi:hypothetical protein Golomagni_00673 [Golovinomyces magnicellulatus]|nr:hypothetical protein Golomagni_00673 [Golovinomyces magnicellulatus]